MKFNHSLVGFLFSRFLLVGLFSFLVQKKVNGFSLFFLSSSKKSVGGDNARAFGRHRQQSIWVLPLEPRRQQVGFLLQWVQQLLYASFAAGINTVAEADYSATFGIQSIATSYASMVVGVFNAITEGADRHAWVNTDLLLVVGMEREGVRSNAFVIYKNGSAWFSGTVMQSSDKRLKQNIGPLGSVTEKFLALTPVRYQLSSSDTNRQEIGLIAQEVQELFPELVGADENGYLALDYCRLSSILLQGFKEQENVSNSWKKHA
jgi:hypothetical protein